MKIMIYISSLGGGGAERVVSTLANCWAAQGHAVMIATLAPVDEDFYPLDRRIERRALGFVGAAPTASGRLLDTWRRIVAVRRQLRGFSPQVAISMIDSANVIMAIAGVGLGGITRLGSERVYPPAHPIGTLWHTLRRFTYGLLDGVIALTAENSEWLSANTFARRVEVIPNPVNYPLPVSSPILDPDSVRTRSRRVMAAGRYVDQKGFDVLIRAFAKIAAEVQEWELTIIGDGPLREVLSGIAADAGVADRVALVGVVGNAGEWYSSADLFVLSSRFEGFPNTLREAMAHGVAVVSTDCLTGPRTLVEPGTNGILVPVDDVDAMACALRELMLDESRRNRLAAAAMTARDKYSPQNIALAWLRFAEVARTSRGRRL